MYLKTAGLVENVSHSEHRLQQLQLDHGVFARCFQNSGKSWQTSCEDSSYDSGKKN